MNIENSLQLNNKITVLENCKNNSFMHLGKILSNHLYTDNESKKFYDLYNYFTTYKPQKKTTVRMLCNWTDSKSLCKLWKRQSKNNDNTWEDIEITHNVDSDYTCIINCPPRNEYIHFDKTIIFRMEPNMEKNPHIWHEWSKPDKKAFLKYIDHTIDHCNSEWHLDKTYSQLKTEPIVKTKIMSTILTSKYFDPGHIKRIDFMKFLQTRDISIDVYGPCSNMNFKNYKGILPSRNKNDGILPYKYTFNVENHKMKNYFTEKFVDAILGECLIFYNGCTNLTDFFDERCFVYLELVDFEKDYQKIIDTINANEWEKRLPYIKEAKAKLLDEMQFFPRLQKIINSQKK